MDLIELHNVKFLSVDSFPLYIDLLKNSLIRMDDFGAIAKGRRSINVYLRKGIDSEKIIRYGHQANRLVKAGAIDNITIKANESIYKLSKPYLVETAGTSNHYEYDEPLILKFLCSSYERRSLKRSKITISDIRHDPSWVVAGSMT